MKFITTLSVALLLVASAIAQATINTGGAPAFGQPYQFTWSGGQGPYFPTIIPAGQVSATPLKTFDQTTGTSLTWIVDIPAGTNINLALRDSSGAQSYSGQLTILPGSGPASGSSSATGSSAATGASTASTPSASSGASAASTGASSASTPSAAAPSSIAITRSATPSAASGTSVRPTTPAAASATPSPSQGAAGNIKVASGLMAAAGLIAVALA